MYRMSILTAICCTAVFAIPMLLGGATPSKTDTQFMKLAAVANMTGAHLGQMAEAQGAQADVKGLGRTLDSDSTHAYQGLQALAGKSGETIPKGIDIRRDKGVAQLEHLKGKSFDQAFLREEIQSDKRVIAEFKSETQHGANADLKAWATSELPTLEAHLETAQNLEKQIQKSK